MKLNDRNERYDIIVKFISAKTLAKGLDLIFKWYYKFIYY